MRGLVLCFNSLLFPTSARYRARKPFHTKITFLACSDCHLKDCTCPQLHSRSMKAAAHFLYVVKIQHFRVKQERSASLKCCTSASSVRGGAVLPARAPAIIPTPFRAGSLGSFLWALLPLGLLWKTLSNKGQAPAHYPEFGNRCGCQGSAFEAALNNSEKLG